MFTVGFHDLLYHYLNPLIYTLSDFVVSGRMTASYFGTVSFIFYDCLFIRLHICVRNGLVLLGLFDFGLTVAFEFSRSSVSVFRITFFAWSSFSSETAFLPARLELASFLRSTFTVFITAFLAFEFLIFTVENLICTEFTFQWTVV